MTTRRRPTRTLTINESDSALNRQLIARKFYRLLLPSIRYEEERSDFAPHAMYSSTESEASSTLSNLLRAAGTDIWATSVAPFSSILSPNLGTRRMNRTVRVQGNVGVQIDGVLDADLALVQRTFDEMRSVDQELTYHYNYTPQEINPYEYNSRLSLTRAHVPWMVSQGDYLVRFGGLPRDGQQIFTQPAQRMIPSSHRVGATPAPLLNKHLGTRTLTYTETEYSTLKPVAKPTYITLTTSKEVVNSLITFAEGSKFAHASDGIINAMVKNGMGSISGDALPSIVAGYIRELFQKMQTKDGQKVEVQNALKANVPKSIHSLVVTGKHTLDTVGYDMANLTGIKVISVVASYGMSYENFKKGVNSKTPVPCQPSFIVTLIPEVIGEGTVHVVRHPRTPLPNDYLSMSDTEMEAKSPHNILVRGDTGKKDHSLSRLATSIANDTNQWTMLTVNEGSERSKPGSQTQLIADSKLVDEVHTIRVCILKGGLEHSDVAILKGIYSGSTTAPRHMYDALIDIFYSYMGEGLRVGAAIPRHIINEYLTRLFDDTASLSVQEYGIMRRFGNSWRHMEESPLTALPEVSYTDYIVRIMASWFYRIGYAPNDDYSYGNVEVETSRYHPIAQRHLGAQYRFVLPYSVTQKGIDIWTALPSDSAMLIDRGALRGVFVSHDAKMSEVDLTRVFDSLIHSADTHATGTSVKVGTVYAPLITVDQDTKDLGVLGYVDGNFVSFQAIINDACAIISSVQSGTAGYFIWHPQFSILIIRDSQVSTFYACVGLISRPSRFVKSHKHYKDSLKLSYSMGSVPSQQIIIGSGGRDPRSTPVQYV